MSAVVGKKFIPYNAAPPDALATSSSLEEYDLARSTERERKRVGVLCLALEARNGARIDNSATNHTVNYTANYTVKGW